MPLEQYPDEELTLAPWLEAIVSARVREAVLEEREAIAAKADAMHKESGGEARAWEVWEYIRARGNP